MDKYFTNFNEGSIANFSPYDRTILDIRDSIGDKSRREDWQAIEGIILGVLFADKELCRSMLCWRSKWQQDKGTVLYELLDRLPKQQSDPPISLLKMIVDIAGYEILHIGSISGHLPLHLAIHQHGAAIGSSLEVISFLAEADQSRPRLSLRGAIVQAMWRKDSLITRYLLSFCECREGLLQGSRPPVWYASRDIFDAEQKITPYLQLLLEATAEQSNFEAGEDIPCCVLQSAIACKDRLPCFDDVRAIAVRDKQYCSNHNLG